MFKVLGIFSDIGGFSLGLDGELAVLRHRNGLVRVSAIVGGA
jgi:hypothetical protein